jgi:hypothetical protein
MLVKAGLNGRTGLNVVPQWELVPWKEIRKYWEQVLEPWSLTN